MKRMIPFLAAISMTGMAVVSPAQAAEKLWEVDGLKGPECAFPDAALGFVFVSNVNGKPDEKDGNGYISRISIDGKTVEQTWASGLNAPKGLDRDGDTLYVADVDALVAIDINTGKVKQKYVGEGAKFLNDVAVGADGVVYVSDTMGNAIFRLTDDKLESWLQTDKLNAPNGLLVEGDRLIVNTWGVFSGEGWATTTAGHMLAVTIADKSIVNIDDGQPIGNLDGLQRLGNGDYLLSDWLGGKILRFDTKSGKASEIMSLGQGNADLGYDLDSKTAFIPQMMEGKLFAYRIE